MEQQKIDQFLTVNRQFFAEEDLITISNSLASIDESKETAIMALKFKNPQTTLLISIFMPWADRLYLGQIGMAVAKLATCGGCGVWTIMDIINAKKNAQKVNMEILNAVL